MFGSRRSPAFVYSSLKFRPIPTIADKERRTMLDNSRRDFICSLGAFLALPLLQTQEPDLILYHGDFLTVDERSARARAVALASGRFFAMGTNDEILHLASGRSGKLDLGGKTVLPGFIDA